MRDRLFGKLEGCGATRFTEIFVSKDKEEIDGCHQIYLVMDKHSPKNDGYAYYDAFCSVFGTIAFQTGPVAKYGRNGLFVEDLLHICRHRLQCYQEGDLACDENEAALIAIDTALRWLHKRTEDRKQRKVEGTNQK